MGHRRNGHFAQGAYRPGVALDSTGPRPSPRPRPEERRRRLEAKMHELRSDPEYLELLERAEKRGEHGDA